MIRIKLKRMDNTYVLLVKRSQIIRNVMKYFIGDIDDEDKFFEALFSNVPSKFLIFTMQIWTSNHLLLMNFLSSRAPQL